MPSRRYFEQVPVFPTTTSVADIPTITLSRLAKNDEQEATKLFSACRDHGFFTLNLDSDAGSSLVQHAEKMYDLTSRTLNLDKAILDRYASKPPKDLLGYKAAGQVKTDDGKLDATEMYTLGQDDMIGSILPRQNPEPIESQREECREFFAKAHETVTVILNALDAPLGVPQGTLANLSSLDRASATSLRLLFTRPENGAERVTLGAHTDIGLITLLFHVAGGLQILPPGSENKHENWRFIRPQPHCALINVGDTLVELTGGVLSSSLHRVVTAPGDQASVPRISLAYLVRPARGGSMARLRGDGKVIPESKADEGEKAQTVDEWAAERAYQIMNGILKPQTNGGVFQSV